MPGGSSRWDPRIAWPIETKLFRAATPLTGVYRSNNARLIVGPALAELRLRFQSAHEIHDGKRMLRQLPGNVHGTGELVPSKQSSQPIPGLTDADIGTQSVEPAQWHALLFDVELPR